MFGVTLATELVSVNASAPFQMKNAPKATAIALAVIVSLSAGGCAPTVDQRGNLPHPDMLAQVQPGKSTQEDVLSILGTPSSTIAYGGETWHYISSKTETTAFFEPKLLDRKVVSVVFDDKGIVRDLTFRGLDDGRDIEAVDRITPTAGKEMSILEQLIGNVGRFSKDPSER